MSDAAARTVFYTVGASVGIVYVARLVSSPGDALREPGEMIRIALGGSFAIVALLIMAEMDDSLARAFAWIILIASVFTYGGRAFQVVSATTRKRNMQVVAVRSVGQATGSAMGNLGSQVTGIIERNAK